MTKEELIQEHHFAQTGQSVAKSQHHADITLEYAKQQSIEFARWIGLEGHLDITQGLLHLSESPEILFDKFITQQSL